MDKIQIEFSKAQYRTLLKLIYLGEWLHESYQDQESKDVKDLVQLIYSYTYEEDAEKMIEFSDKLRTYFPTKAMEQIIHRIVDEYDEYTFWEELVHNMANKDFYEKYGEELISQMSLEEKITQEQPFIDKYMDEFETNGLNNLIIKE